MKYFLSILLGICFIPASSQVNADLVIRNGRLLDGTGNSWVHGDVAIKDGRIYKTGRLGNITATKEIDAKGAIVCPGFIDVHTHIEGNEFRQPTADNFIYNGVTTVVTGNCGASHTDIKKYLDRIDSLRPSINVATLVGHNDVRKAVMGTAQRLPTEEEMKSMEALVAQAMKDGAVGLSSGLEYVPGAYAEANELVRLGKSVAPYHGVYASHMRDEGDSIQFAIDETIRVGELAGIPVQISHFKLSGQHNWGRNQEIINQVIRARESGIDVTIDQYPYTASSTGLGLLFPDDVLADSQDSINARLARPEVRKYVAAYMMERLKKRKLKHWSYARVANFSADSSYNGKSIEEINLMMKRKHKAKAEAETIMDLMQKGGASMVYHSMGDEDVRAIMRYPFNMFASDASVRIFGQGAPHPRGYGTNARILARYVRDEKILSLEEAVRRMTSLPAQKFGLKDRGLLREGYAADILIFNEKEVQDHSTFEKPHAYSSGFLYVLVNGELVLAGGQHLGTRSGKALRKIQD